MSADLRTLVAHHRKVVRYNAGAYGNNPPDHWRQMAQATADFIESMVPLYDAWLTARPPCPTCGGTTVIGVPASDPTFAYRCRDCSDGIQPFDKWTAGLVADSDKLRQLRETFPARPKRQICGAQ